MLLSIVMMVKNEEENLLKSLPALNKLREAIDSELIILDTGSDDNTLNVAKQFTDKVFESKWNNNFAEMRNKSFEYATGEWLLVLDADEELTDYSNLIDFFATNKHQIYNSATISLKNFLSEDFSKFTYANLPRMFRRKNFKYKGAIHEQPLFKKPVYNPSSGIASFNHYGYIFQDQEFRLKKMKRNESILLSELKKNQNDPYINFQLGVNFSILGNFDESRRYLEKSLKIYEKAGVLYYPVYASLIELLFSTNKYVQCKEVCLKYLKKEDTNFDIHYKLGELYQIENNFSESIKHYNKYLYYVENYHLSRQARDISCTARTKGYEHLALINLIKIYFNLEQYEDVIIKINELKNINTDKVSECYSILIESLNSLNKNEDILSFYNSINNDSDKSRFLFSIELLLCKLKDDEKDNLYKILSKMDNNYGKLNSMRLNKSIDFDVAKNILDLESDGYFGDLLDIAINEGIEIEELLKDVPYYKIKQFILYLVKYNKSSINNLYQYLLSRELSFNQNKNRIYAIISEILINVDKISTSKKLKIFPIYTESRYRYIKDTYSSHLSNNELLSVLNNDSDFFIVKFMIAKNIKKENPLDIVKALHAISKEFPRFAKFLLPEIEAVQDDFNKGNDFKSLQNQYLNIIKQELSKGNISITQALISDFESTDNTKFAEIQGIKAIIEIQNENYKKAHALLKEAYLMDTSDLDTLFNLGYLYTLESKFDEAIECFKVVAKNSKDKNLIKEALENIEALQQTLI